MLIISVCTITRKNVPSKIFHLNLFEVLSSGIFHFLQFDLDYWGFVSSTEISQLAKNEANFARVNRKSCMCTGIVYKLLPLFIFRLTYLILSNLSVAILITYDCFHSSESKWKLFHGAAIRNVMRYLPCVYLFLLKSYLACYAVLLEVMYVVNLPEKKSEFISSYRIF